MGSRLNFSPINEAFILGSDQIKNTQEEIAKLKALVSESNAVVPKKTSITKEPPEEKIGPPDQVSARFDKRSGSSEDDFDYTFLKLIKHPKFDNIVKNYISIKYPEFNNSTLNELRYSSKESFGKRYVCSDIKNYIIFFIVSLVIYLFLSLCLRPTKP